VLFKLPTLLQGSIDRKVIVSVYISCALMFGAVLLVDQSTGLQQKLLHPLDNSYSILGSKSVFKAYLGRQGGQRVYAFLPYWSLGERDLFVDQLTDLSYFGLTVDDKARVITTDGPYKKWRDDKTLARTVTKVKKAGGNVSVTLICHNDDDIDAVLACSTCWEDLVQDVIKELSWAGIRDLNVDFEYSGYTTPENAEKYAQLVGLLNKKLDEAFGDSFVVVSAYADSADKAEKEDVRLTNPKSLAQSADAIFIMAYDFHRPTSANAGPVSPLAGSYTTTRLNLTKSLEGYLQVVPASKIVLGLPFYGYDWLVEDAEPMSARVDGSDETGFSGSKTYAEITNFLVKKQIKPLWDKVSETPYFNYIDEETGVLRQVWYDDVKSLKLKANLATQKDLLGVGVWALGFEGGYTDIWEAFSSND
jgi:spore germination protein YaaH